MERKGRERRVANGTDWSGRVGQPESFHLWIGWDEMDIRLFVCTGGVGMVDV